MQSEYQVETYCKNCVFAEYTDNRQTGCELGRHKVFNPEETTREEDGKHAYIFNRFCTAFRPEEWKLVLDDEEKKDLVATVKSEIFPPLGIFVFLKTTVPNPMQNLKNRIQEIKDQTVGSLRYIVVINSKVEYNEEIHSILNDSFDFDETEFHIVQTLLEQRDLLYIDDAFKHAKNGWIYVTESNWKIRKDLFEAIDNNINVKLNRIVLVEPSSGIQGMIFQAAVHKFLDGSNNILDIKNAEQVQVNFLEKVRALAKNSDEKTVFTQEEFFDAAS
tara:strand:- start:1879 stop:2703 length:825 start_codon:yes stop_codon:yes gene_type:complete